MMVIDMHAKGVEVRPLRQITGHSHFNEVFFDNVRVPLVTVVALSYANLLEGSVLTETVTRGTWRCRPSSSGISASPISAA